MLPTPNMPSPYGGAAPMSQSSPMHQTEMMMDPTAHKKHMMEMCKKYHHHLMHVEGTDGKMYEGILDGADDDYVYILIPVGDSDMDGRQYPIAGGYDYDGYGYGAGGYPYGGGYGGYPYGGPFYGYPRRFRRFRRFPLAYYLLNRLLFPIFY